MGILLIGGRSKKTTKMNALTRSAASTLPRASKLCARRTKATTAFKEPSFSESWLQDKSTYPIIVIVGGALVGCTSYMAHKVMYHPDVRVKPDTRTQIIRTWGGKN